MSLVHNERVKLMANALDRASTACFAIGVITPFASHLAALLPNARMVDLLAATYIWVCAAVVLHRQAHRTLGDLR